MSVYSPSTDLQRFLAALPAMDWTDFMARTKENEELLNEVLEQRSSLRQLIEGLRDDPARLAMCEKDEFRYKLVLYRGEEQGFRLRLHMWRTGFSDCVHAHRFSYTARLLNGSYQHTLWHTDQEVYPSGLEEVREKQLPLDHPFVSRHIDVDQIQPTLQMQVQAGQTYSQHHSVLSSTITEPDTISLFVRGPAARDYSIQWYTDSDTIAWRGGAATVPDWRQEEVNMTPADVDLVLKRLTELEIL